MRTQHNTQRPTGGGLATLSDTDSAVHRQGRDRSHRQRRLADQLRRQNAHLNDGTGAHRSTAGKATDVVRPVSDNQRSLRRTSAVAPDNGASGSSEHGATVDQLQTRLRELAIINVDLCGEMAETRALSAESQRDIARLIGQRQEDATDLLVLGVRLLQLTERLGIRMELRIQEIFVRRGWPTRL